jgi:D-xylose transport system substrate-binding protein
VDVDNVDEPFTAVVVRCPHRQPGETIVKKRVRLVFGLALTLSLLGVAGCGDDDGDDTGTDNGGDTGDGGGGEGPIWVLLPDTASSERWENDDRRFFQQFFEDAGLVEGEDFNIVNAEGDAQAQQSQAEQAIADDASVILLTSLDTGSGATIIDTAEEAGVEVVEYDRFNTGGSGGAAYVSFDNVQVGATMAEVLEPTIDELGLDSPRVVMLNGGEEDNNSFLFRDGYAETVEARVDAGDWTLVADQHVPGWDNDEAQTIMEQILVDASNGVDAVFAANDGLAQATINALQAAGIGPLPVSGQDATAPGIQNILLGLQTMTVYKPIEAEAAVAAAVALALRAGDDPADIETDFEFSIIGINAEDGSPTDSAEGDGVVPYFALVPIGVTADNIADTVIADGFRTVEEICVGDVAATDFCQEN